MVYMAAEISYFSIIAIILFFCISVYFFVEFYRKAIPFLFWIGLTFATLLISHLIGILAIPCLEPFMVLFSLVGLMSAVYTLYLVYLQKKGR